jgi:cysteinyl-tRNA synthetase
MNITDVDDKIIRGAVLQGKTLSEYTAAYVKAFQDDMATLRMEQPEQMVRATEHIDDMVTAIQQLEERGFTYLSEGSVYYRIAQFPEYGKLSHNDFSGMKAGARVDVDEYEKDDARDFVLWKAQSRRAVLGYAARTGPSGLAHRVLRDGDEVSRRDARHPRRRNRPHLPPSRE